MQKRHLASLFFNILYIQACHTKGEGEYILEGRLRSGEAFSRLKNNLKYWLEGELIVILRNGKKKRGGGGVEES